jgi:hypothetical protein
MQNMLDNNALTAPRYSNMSHLQGFPTSACIAHIYRVHCLAKQGTPR